MNKKEFQAKLNDITFSSETERQSLYQSLLLTILNEISEGIKKVSKTGWITVIEEGKKLVPEDTIPSEDIIKQQMNDSDVVDSKGISSNDIKQLDKSLQNKNEEDTTEDMDIEQHYLMNRMN